MSVMREENCLPKFSVVVAAYNAERSLGNTIQSLLDQDYPNYEIIIVDDASSDRTNEIAASYKCNLIRLDKNSGPGIGRNVGVKAGSGEHIAFTDADCIVPVDWLSRFETRLRDDTIVGVTGGYSDAAADTFISRYMMYELEKRQKNLNGRCRCAITANLACRRDAFDAAGGFPIYYITSPASSKKPYHGNEDNELAFLLTEANGDIWWDTEIKVKHVFRTSILGYYKQQRNFAETALVSLAQFPAMLGVKMNYNGSNTAAQLISTAVIFISFVFLFFRPSIALPALTIFFLLHMAINAEALISIARNGMGFLGTIASVFLLFLRNCAWYAGLARGTLFSFRIIAGRLLSNIPAKAKNI